MYSIASSCGKGTLSWPDCPYIRKPWQSCKCYTWSHRSSNRRIGVHWDDSAPWIARLLLPIHQQTIIDQWKKLLCTAGIILVEWDFCFKLHFLMIYWKPQLNVNIRFKMLLSLGLQNQLLIMTRTNSIQLKLFAVDFTPSKLTKMIFIS